MSILFEELEETARQLRELKANKTTLVQSEDFEAAAKLVEEEQQFNMTLINQLRSIRQQMALLDPHSLDYAEQSIRYNSIMVEQEWENSERIGAYVLLNKQKQKELDQLQEIKKQMLANHQFSEANKVRDQIQELIAQKLANQRSILDLKKRMEMFQGLMDPNHHSGS
jgi:protein-arginine kinase activator protein McsA